MNITELILFGMAGSGYKPPSISKHLCRYVVTHKYKCLMQLYYTEHTYIVQGWVLISLFCEIRIWNCFCRPRATFDEIAPQPKQIYKNGAWDNHTSSVACRRVHGSFPADSLVEKGCTFTARGCLRFNWLFAICLLVLFIMKSPRVVRNSLLHATQEVGCSANVRLLLYERCKLHTCLAWPLKEEVASIVYEENHMLCSNPIVHVSVCMEFFFHFYLRGSKDIGNLLSLTLFQVHVGSLHKVNIDAISILTITYCCRQNNISAWYYLELQLLCP